MKKHNILFQVSFLIQILFCSAVAQAKLGAIPPLEPEDMAKRLAQYEYDVTYTIDNLGKTVIGRSIESTLMQINYVDALGGRNRSLRFDIYKSLYNFSPFSPVIIIFPAIHGVSLVETGFAEYFAKLGYIAVISHVAKNVLEFQDLPSLFAEFTDSMVDNRILLDYIEQMSGVDARRIGVLGISLGAIRSGLFYGIEKRVKSVFMIVGGGNVAGIMAHSQQEDVSILRTRFMATYGYRTIDEYEQALRDGMNWDPIWSAQQRSGLGIHMVIGQKDDKVHTEYQHELFAKLNGATKSEYNFGHTETIGLVFLNKSIVSRFFKNQLGVQLPDSLDEDQAPLFAKAN